MKSRVPCVLLALVVSRAAGAVEEADSPAQKARKNLPRALAAGSNDEVKACLSTLVRAGGRENLEVIVKLLPRIPEAEDAIYWDLIQGICSFADRPALEYLGEAIVGLRGTAHARDLIYGLARNRSPSAVQALAPVLQKGAPDLQLMAAEKLGTIVAPEAVDALIAALKREEKKPDSDLCQMVVEGLETITGQRFHTNTVNWEGWWQKNRDKPLAGPGSSRDDRGTGTVVDKLDSNRAKSFQGLERAPKKSVIVLSAEFPERDLNNDHMDRILQSMGVPHEVVKRPDFEKFDLRGVGAILINCAQFHEFCICPTCKPGGAKQNRLYQCQGCEKHKKFSGKLSSAAISKIQDFVKRGGFLFCEDWTVKEVLERAFPQYVSAGKVLKQGSVDVVPARGRASHPFLKGIFSPERPKEGSGDDGDGPAGGGGPGSGAGKGGTVAKKPDPKPGDPDPPEMVQVKHHWTIDDESWALKVTDGSKVAVLLTSGKLQSQSGEGVVALYFRPGGDGSPAAAPGARRRGPGMVMQVLSHFGKQESTADEHTLQNLLLNFLLAANVARTQDQLPEKGGKGKKPAGKDAGKKPGQEGEEEGAAKDGEGQGASGG